MRGQTPFLLALLALAACPALLYAQDVAGCQAIDQPDSYTLTAALTGANISASPLSGSACIKIAASDVVFDCNGYNISNNGTASAKGILLNGSLTNVTVRNCPGINYYAYGVYAYQANNSLFTNITVRNNSNDGIQLNESSNNLVLGNVAFNNSQGTGSSFHIGAGSSNNTLANNTASYSYYGFWIDSSSGNTLIDNTANFTSGRGFQLNDNADYNNLTHNTAHNNTIYGFLLITNADYNILSGNTAYSSGQSGFSLFSSSSSNNFTHNTAYRNGFNFEIQSGSNDLFVNNSATNGTSSGFYVNGAYHTFTNNTVYGNSYGFQISSSYNNFTNNSASNNTVIGFYLPSSSGYNTFTNNTANNNTQYGFYLYVSSNTTLTGDIANNNVIGGINILYGGGLNISNCTLQENGQSDFSIGALYAEQCNHRVENIIGSGNRPINYTNATVNWNNLEASEIVLCRADNSVLDNITVRGSDTLNNNGLFAYSVNNVTVTDSNSSGNAYGIYLGGASNSTVERNNLLNSSYGISVTAGNLPGSNNTIANNVVRGGWECFELSGNYGSSMPMSNSSMVNNTAIGCSSRAFIVSSWARNNTIANNTASGAGGGYGFYIQYSSDNNTIVNNTISGFSNGFFLYQVRDNNLTSNNVSNSTSVGFYLSQADANNLTGNIAYNNSYGYYIARSSYNTISSATTHQNSVAGIYIYDEAGSTGTKVIAGHFYNNSADVEVSPYWASSGGYINMSGTIFDNPAGNYTDYVNLSIVDNIPGWTVYTLNWSSQNAAMPPPGTSSFAGKFIDIRNISGSDPIDSITWHWNDAEVAAGGYNASRFGLFRFSGSTWSTLNVTPDTVSDKISMSNLAFGSVFALLQRDDLVPPVVTPNSPENNSVFNASSVGFNFTAVDAIAPNVSCSLYLDGTLQGANSSVLNSTPTVISATGLANGNYTWHVNCTDPAGNTASSETRNITINRTLCPLIESSGSYNLSENIEGADNDFSELGGAGSCVRITASDVDFDCQGYNVTGPGAGTTAGVFIVGPVSNVTVRNCNISWYSYGGGLFLTDSVQLINNTASNNSGIGFVLYMSTNTLLANNTVFNNGLSGFIQGGTAILTSDGTRIMNDHYYGNPINLFVGELFGAPFTLDVSDVIFDNPMGNFQNYTTLSLNDTVQLSEAYMINWSSSPAFPPAGNASFRQKFIGIAGGDYSIDNISWSWQGWETSGYDESSFVLLGYDGADWTDMGATLDTTTHTLSMSDLVALAPVTYGIFGNRTDYVFIPSSGGAANAKTMSVNYSFTCPDGKAVFSATSSNRPVSGTSIRLIYTEPPYFESIGTVTTDDNGVASIVLAREGWYQVQASRSGYQGYDSSFYFTPCAIAPPPSQGNITQPPANVTQPQQNQTQPPAIAPNVTTEQAQQAISDAQAAISEAQAGGKNVTAAQEKFAEAQAAFDAGDFSTAKNLADDAKNLALNAAASGQTATPSLTPPPSTTPQPPAKGFDWLPIIALLVAAGLVLAVGAGAYLMFMRPPKPGFKK